MPKNARDEERNTTFKLNESTDDVRRLKKVDNWKASS
jgi:hypothetical protein